MKKKLKKPSTPSYKPALPRVKPSLPTGRGLGKVKIRKI